MRKCVCQLARAATRCAPCARAHRVTLADVGMHMHMDMRMHMHMLTASPL